MNSLKTGFCWIDWTLETLRIWWFVMFWKSNFYSKESERLFQDQLCLWWYSCYCGFIFARKLLIELHCNVKSSEVISRAFIGFIWFLDWISWICRACVVEFCIGCQLTWEFFIVLLRKLSSFFEGRTIFPLDSSPLSSWCFTVKVVIRKQDIVIFTCTRETKLCWQTKVDKLRSFAS